MIDAKKTEKIDVKFKDIVMKEGKVVDFEDGTVINLLANLEEIYGDRPFNLTCTTKEEEVLEVTTADFD